MGIKEILKKIKNSMYDFASNAYISLSREEQEQELINELDEVETIFQDAKDLSLKGREIETRLHLKRLEDFIADSEQKQLLQEKYPEDKLTNCYLRSILWGGVNAAEKNCFRYGLDPACITSIVRYVRKQYALKGKKLSPRKYRSFILKYHMKECIKELKEIAESGIGDNTHVPTEVYGRVAKECLAHAGYDKANTQVLNEVIETLWRVCYTEKIKKLEKGVMKNNLADFEELEYWVNALNQSYARRGLKTRLGIAPELYARVDKTRQKQERIQKNNENKKQIYALLDLLGIIELSRKTFIHRLKDIRDIKLSTRFSANELEDINCRIKTIKHDSGYWSEKKKKCWNGKPWQSKLKLDQRNHDKRKYIAGGYKQWL